MLSGRYGMIYAFRGGNANKKEKERKEKKEYKEIQKKERVKEEEAE